MKFISNLEDAKRKIISMYPEFTKSNFVSDNSGWANYVVKVDNKFIFRFSRNEESYSTINIEDKLLSKLKKVLPKNIQIPDYKYKDLNDSPFVGYEMIKGKFLSEELYNKLSIVEKEKILDNMKIFLDNLHSLDYEDLEIPVLNVKKYYKSLYDEIKEKCYEYFDAELKNTTDNFFNNFLNSEVNYKDCIVHGDLTTDHILITDNGIGIIDFGDVRIFDPIFDLAWTYELDKNIIYKFLDNSIDLSISSFYVNVIPYHRVLYGISINNQEEINIGINGLKKIKK